jgi:hypothetical protein
VRRALLTVALLAAGACGHFDPQSGYVTGHDFKPAHSIHHSDPIYSTSCSGKPLVCTSLLVGLNNWTEHIPDRYWIRVRDDATDKKGEHQEGWVPCDRETYYRYSDGNHWPDAR